MILDWQGYVPMAVILSCVFIVIGACFINRLWGIFFWRKLFQWSNTILILGCIGFILSLTQIQGFFTSLDSFLFGLTISIIPLIILFASLKLRGFSQKKF